MRVGQHFCVLILATALVPDVLARAAPKMDLRWAVPQSDKIVVAQITRIARSAKETNVSVRMTADVEVLFPIKNSQSNEQLRLAFVTFPPVPANGPDSFEPKTNGIRYLMFLRKDPHVSGQFVAVTDPDYSPRALVELSPHGTEVIWAQLSAEVEKKHGSNADEYVIEYGTELDRLVKAIVAGSTIGIDAFRKTCERIAERETTHSVPQDDKSMMTNATEKGDALGPANSSH